MAQPIPDRAPRHTGDLVAPACRRITWLRITWPGINWPGINWHWINWHWIGRFWRGPGVVWFRAG
jgi:hypothetical protein